MSNKPLQYESLKTVLQFMEPNLRIQLSQRIPSIRQTDKIIPMKIKKLSFESMIVNINDTSYMFSMYRAYPPGSVVPEKHQLVNEGGGYPYDLDEFGFGVKSDDVIPGDILIDGELTIGPTDNNEQKHLERHLELFEKALAEKIERGQANDHVEYIVEEFGEPVDQALKRSIRFDVERDGGLSRRQRKRKERERLDMLHGLSGRCLQHNIDEFKNDLLPYYCRRDNVPAPFTPLIMMTIEKNDVTQQDYRYVYHVKLQAGVRHLCNVIFGGRRHPVRIGTLQWYPGLTISLPSDLKLKIETFKIPGNVSNAYELFKNLIHEESFPLNSLIVTRGIERREDYEHNMVKTAKKLIVGDSYSELDNIMELFLNIRNPIAHLDFYSRNFTVQDQVQLVRIWVGSNKRPGTMLSYRIRADAHIQELIDRVSDEFTGWFVQDRIYLIPMQGTNCLLVACNENPEWEDRYEPKWTVTLQIMTFRQN